MYLNWKQSTTFLGSRHEMSTNPMIVFTLGMCTIIGAHILGPYINSKIIQLAPICSQLVCLCTNESQACNRLRGCGSCNITFVTLKTTISQSRAVVIHFVYGISMSPHKGGITLYFASWLTVINIKLMGSHSCRYLDACGFFFNLSPDR